MEIAGVRMLIGIKSRGNSDGNDNNLFWWETVSCLNGGTTALSGPLGWWGGR